MPPETHGRVGGGSGQGIWNQTRPRWNKEGPLVSGGQRVDFRLPLALSALLAPEGQVTKPRPEGAQAVVR